uniref:V-type proton ATPase subunit C n=1 Tax=Heterorhabditis bacteriophora TaxID=37862 RepID=A0A1I7WU90_HETBA
MTKKSATEHPDIEEADLVYFLPEGVQLFTINVRKYYNSINSCFTEINSIIIGNKNFDSGFVTTLFRFSEVNLSCFFLDMLVAILLPSNIGTQLEEEFKQILSEFAILRDQDVKKELTSDENRRISDRIAQFLISSGERIAWGVQTTTVKVVTKVEDKGEKYRAELEETNKPMGLNPVVKGTKVVAKCTRYLCKFIFIFSILASFTYRKIFPFQ